MTRIAFSMLTLAAVFTSAIVFATEDGGQAPAAIAKAAALTRTADGKPDLQGNWTNATLTPIERPDNTPLALPKDQVQKREQAFRDRIAQLSEDSDPNRPAPPKGGDGSTGAA